MNSQFHAPRAHLSVDRLEDRCVPSVARLTLHLPVMTSTGPVMEIITAVDRTNGESAPRRLLHVGTEPPPSWLTSLMNDAASPLPTTLAGLKAEASRDLTDITLLFASEVNLIQRYNNGDIIEVRDNEEIRIIGGQKTVTPIELFQTSVPPDSELGKSIAFLPKSPTILSEAVSLFQTVETHLQALDAALAAYTAPVLLQGLQKDIVRIQNDIAWLESEMSQT